MSHYQIFTNSGAIRVLFAFLRGGGGTDFDFRISLLILAFKFGHFGGKSVYFSLYLQFKCKSHHTYKYK